MTMASPRSYLDWNASAPLRPEARDALREACERFGNPSSHHAEGREARGLVDSAREEVAAFMGCRPEEVVFTSGGTEANNLALNSLASTTPRRRTFGASRIEHPSVRAPLDALERGGWRGLWLPVDEGGAVDPSALGDEAGFGVLQYANHETGTLQPVDAFHERCTVLSIPWHCDAVQGWGRTGLAISELGCATASLSGHKLGAPPGVGALFVRDGTEVEPLLRGGPQERERRAGTENVPGIAALGAACAAVREDLEGDVHWTRGLRDRLVAAVRERHPLVRINGPEDPDEKLPNTVNLTFPGIEGTTLAQALDLEGIAVSTGSACTSGALAPSEVLTALGLSDWRVRGAIRISLGPTTRPEDIDRCLETLDRVVARLEVR